MYVTFPYIFSSEKKEKHDQFQTVYEYSLDGPLQNNHFCLDQKSKMAAPQNKFNKET
jgi:hypothetical protein